VYFIVKNIIILIIPRTSKGENMNKKLSKDKEHKDIFIIEGDILIEYIGIGINSVIIPQSVRSIGSFAFRGCKELTSIIIPNSVTSINECAFYECKGLSSIVIPESVISIGNYAFSCCTGLVSIIMPNSVTRIGDWAFGDCRGLISIVIPNSVTSIGCGAFYCCRGLTSVAISESVRCIGYRAFDGCIGLTSIAIPDSVTDISDYAFDKGIVINNFKIKENKMEQILGIFSKIGSTASRIEKEKILFENKDNELFKTILEFVYNPYIVTGISTKKINKKIKNKNPMLQIHSVDSLMEYLRINNTGSDIDISIIQEFISTHDDALKNLYKQIITKDLKCGITSTTINNIYGTCFIPSFNVMLAKDYFDYEDKIEGDIIITKKIDGCRNVAKNQDDVTMFSRQGQSHQGFINIENDIREYLPKRYVYDGEFVSINNNNLNSDDLYRETMSIVREDGIKKDIVFHIFDMIPVADFEKGYSSIPCYLRKKMLKECLSNIPKTAWITEVPILYEGNDKKIVMELLDKMVSEEQEGIMVNISNAGYSCKRTKDILKVKKFKTADLRVMNIIEGMGQNKGQLGKITIQFEHNEEEHECKCGSGFSQEERVLYWNEPHLILDKIVTIDYFKVSKNKKGGFGLRFPTWKSIIRDDKFEISMY